MPTFGPKLTRRERVRLNLDPVMVAVADGLHEIATEIGVKAQSFVHDFPPYEAPWADWHKKWGTAAWALGKKVAGQADKPREMRTTRTGADAVVGFPYPARFHETGTEFQPARPFLGPAATSIVTSGEAQRILSEHIPKGPGTPGRT